MNPLKPALALWLAIFVTAFAADESPKIEFDRTVYDFGTTSKVESVSGRFIVRNTGKRKLEIGNLGGTCVCLKAEIEHYNLDPGESCALRFTLSIGPSEGTIVEQLFVPSNDPQSSNAVLTIQLRIPPTFEVQPPVVQLKDLAPGATTNVELRVHRTDGRPLHITKIECLPLDVHAEIRPEPDSSNQTARVFLDVTAPAKPGPFQWIYSVHTGQRYPGGIPQPSFYFQVNGRVVPAKP